MTDDESYNSDGGHPSWGNPESKCADMKDAFDDGYQRGYSDGIKASDLCSTCKVQKRSGGLPCHWRADLDIAAMKVGSPGFVIVKCEHWGRSE